MQIVRARGGEVLGDVALMAAPTIGTIGWSAASPARQQHERFPS